MVGLAMLGAMTPGGGGEARAGTIGITISGGFTPVGGDPPYLYIFDVFLDPGFEVDQTDFFRIDGLNGVTSGSLSHQPPPAPPGFVWVPNPGLSNITWTFLGTTPIPNNNPVGSNIEVPLGQFEVQTTVNFPNGPPVPPGTMVPYTFTVHHIGDGPASGSGVIVLTAIPEPSSIILLALGAAALPAIAARRKRRRIAGTA
jgi:hypothetical protein